VQENVSDSALPYFEGPFKTVCVALGLRSLMQIVNSIDFLANGSTIAGGRVQLLIIEQCLEVGQGVILLVALLLKACDSETLKMAADKIRSICYPRTQNASPPQDEVAHEAANPNDAVVFPELAFLRTLSPDCATNALRSRAAVQSL